MVVVVRVCAMGRVLRAMVFLRALGIARGLGECQKVANGRGAQGGDKFRSAITRLLPLPPIVRQLARHRRIISRIRRTPRIFEFFSPLASQIYFDQYSIGCIGARRGTCLSEWPAVPAPRARAREPAWVRRGHLPSPPTGELP